MNALLMIADVTMCLWSFAWQPPFFSRRFPRFNGALQQLGAWTCDAHGVGAPALAQPNGKHLLYKYTWHNRKYPALRFVTHVLWKQTQPGAFSKHPGTALKHGSASHKWASWLPACKRSTRNLPQGYQHDHSAFPTWLRVSYGRTRSIVLLRPFSPDQRCPCSWKASAALPNAGLLNPSQSARATDSSRKTKLAHWKVRKVCLWNMLQNSR